MPPATAIFFAARASAMIGASSPKRFTLRRTFSSIAAATRSLGCFPCAANDRGLDRLYEIGQVARKLGAFLHHFDRRRDGAAIGVSEHHDKRHAEELHGVFETGKAVVIQEIAGKPHHEDVARPLIEREFRRDAAVRTGNS